MPYAYSDHLQQITPSQFVDTDGDLWEYDELSGLFKKIKKRVKRVAKKVVKKVKKDPLGFATEMALTTVSGGAYQLAPKKFRKTIEKAGRFAIPAIAGGAAFSAIGGAKLFGNGNIGQLASSLVGKTGLPFNRIMGALQGMDTLQLAGVQDASSRGGQLPPYLLSLLANANRPVAPQNPIGPMRGGPAYPPVPYYPPGAFAPVTPRAPAKAGMFGDMPPWAVALLAASAVGAVVMFTQQR